MGYKNFEYRAPTCDDGGRTFSISLFIDDERETRWVEEDCGIAGLTVMARRTLDDLQGAVIGASRGFADLVYLDVRKVDARMLGLLCRLDGDLARIGTKVVVGTVMECLDDVFGCFEQSGAQILIQPSRVDRVLSFSKLKGELGGRVREMSGEDRMALIRLSEQVGQMAEHVARLSELNGVGGKSAFAFADTIAPDRSEMRQAIDSASSAPQPDPRIVRQVIRSRQRRASLFAGDLFADPAWDMLLDLTAARGEHRRVSVTSLCIAAAVPATTALRWIDQMIAAGWFEKVRDTADGRRAFISLTDKAADAMSRYFAQVDAPMALAA